MKDWEHRGTAGISFPKPTFPGKDECMSRRGSGREMMTMRIRSVDTSLPPKCQLRLTYTRDPTKIIAYLGDENLRLYINLAPSCSDLRHLWMCADVASKTLARRPGISWETMLETLEAQGMRMRCLSTGGMVIAHRQVTVDDEARMGGEVEELRVLLEQPGACELLVDGHAVADKYPVASEYAAAVRQRHALLASLPVFDCGGSMALGGGEM